MNLFQILVVSGLVLQSSAQIFPFSNLRAFFDPKAVQTKDQEPTNSNSSRPSRQTDPEAGLPPLHEFDSPDIFTINRGIENHRLPPTKRHPSSTTPGPYKPKRRGNGVKYSSRIPEPIQKLETEYSDAVFITPRPNHGFRQVDNEEEDIFSKVKSKSRSKGRKPEQIPDFERTAEPVEFGTVQVTTDEGQTTFPFSNKPVPQSSDTDLSSGDPPFVESVPSVTVAVRENQFTSHDGLIDYLVPPKLPSVYDKTLKRQKSRHPASSGASKLKRPPLAHSKKDHRIRIKKLRTEVKATSVPQPERLTTPAKRHIGRRRPSHHRDISPPLRKPSSAVVEKKLPKIHRLQQQAAIMDEQITAETGFTGSASHHPHSGGQRVEFQMHGQKGPHSYKFGYDTGKGHNRQFRFEEKDNHGRVKGHYGYYDKDGKLQVVNYEADPEHGFKAESV